MTVLGTHAIAELDYQGVVDPERAALISIVGAFADFPYTSFAALLDKVQKLIHFQPLSELTNDPDEWQLQDTLTGGQSVWQSKRWPDAWTYDPTFAVYFLLSGHNGGPTGPFNTVPALS
ncbi:hypothetical protein ACFWY9_28565 [Amycolatopsis sp. NPDC059027]|uniref:hypothetical protein n=1 Tax=Amycolatopsis sp. NPDC059027 TaxID=3346709 RepID=UPI00366B2E53